MALRPVRTGHTGRQGRVTYKGDQGCQQQDAHQEILKLLHHQLPQGFPWNRRVKSTALVISPLAPSPSPLPAGGFGGPSPC